MPGFDRNGDRILETSKGQVVIDFGPRPESWARIKIAGQYREVDEHSILGYLTSGGLPVAEAKAVREDLLSDWRPPAGEQKTGAVYMDVGWRRRVDEERGFSPRDESDVIACWNVENDAHPERLADTVGFDDVDEALDWARARAPMILVRLGPTEDTMYSAGERRATRELPEFGGTDLTPYPEWPPRDWPNTALPPS